MTPPPLREGLTEKQLDTLRHMLGINDPWMPEPTPSRDYFCASSGDPELAELARLGLVRLYSQRNNYDWYATTDAGKDAAMRSHKTIRYTKAQRVYGKFLDIRDCYSELTFKEFITSPEFADSRRAA